MIVQRVTLNVKRGRAREAAAVILTELAKSWAPRVVRVYTPDMGQSDVVAVEAEFESPEEHYKVWREYRAKPEATEFFERLADLRERGGTNELWDLAE